MSFFKYNSKHKIITGIAILMWAAYSFSGLRKNNSYDEYGKVLHTGNIVDGKNHGKWIWYYPNGKKKMEGTFNKGVREGNWITYNPDGSVKLESNYNNDKLNGEQTSYLSSYTIFKTYKNDVLLSEDTLKR